MGVVVLVPFKRKGETHVMKIDYDDWEKLKNNKWFINKTKEGYLYVRNRRRGYLHRIVNNTPKNLVTDHINGNKLDNRKCNLRSATTAQNTCNLQVRSTSRSGFRGVSFHGIAKKYLAQISVGKKYFYLGLFETAEEAALAYNAAAIKYHKQFARLNEVLYRKL